MIKSKINEEIKKSLKLLNIEYNEFIIEKCKSIEFGDFSSNVSFILSKKAGLNPMLLAEKIVEKINQKEFFNITITKPGFINFFIKPEDNNELLKKIIEEGDGYGKFPKKNKKYSVEYVSANPTGYIHIGHARNAALGSTVSNILKWYGYDVVTEYVVNDAGNQMNNLATAVFIRYQQLYDVKIELPEDSYHGEEIILVANSLKEKYGDKYLKLNIDSNNRIDNTDYEHEIRWFARDFLLEIIKKDLLSMGVEIELYFSEYQIHKDKLLDGMIKTLKDKKVAYEKDGAVWLETTKFGDDKDRVLIKSDGDPTYFAPDIIYHNIKWTNNNVDVLINIWGADHYSYITRMKAAMEALGFDPKDLIVLCMQMVKLVKNGQDFKMSKRTGNSLTTRDLIEAIGKDAARWFLVSQSSNNHIEIDVEVATNKNNNNPIFYVQYAYARANQLVSKVKFVEEFNSDLLISDIERELINELYFFKYTIENCAVTYEPYKMTVYLYNLAKLFHNYYSNTKINAEDNKKQNQQINLIISIMQVIKNGLTILGISAPKQM